ncbi:hypothetical protein [Flavobacterium taihuense]|uniref:DNA-binding protein n=1 Tax=Flavobacterium taihuense TaxID=2857508 RepID=A0ABS6Y0A7_9FLAO|nr:hypothetical protein [Flavobacterium taihuense]MBW4362350.1 hypothetical protein [Flavobacterium taihuense]
MKKRLNIKMKNGLETANPIDRKADKQLNIFGLAEHLNKTPLSLYLLVKTKQVPYVRVEKQPILSLSIVETYFLNFEKITNC